MSGPKAVRVVSRQERIARCRSILADLDAQVAEWLRVGKKLGIISDADRSGTEEKVSLLLELLRADKFDQVERQGPVVVSFLQRDLEERIDKRAEKKRREKTVRRRLGIAAAQTLEMIAASGQDIDPSIIESLEKASAGSVGDPRIVERSINDGVAALSAPVVASALSIEHQALADSLRGSQEIQTISDWVVANPQFDDDLATKVDGYIADLEASEDEAVSTPFAERAIQVRVISDRGRRRMLLDTLIIDLADEVKSRRNKRKLFTQALSLRAFLEQDDEFSKHEAMGKISRLIDKWTDIDFAGASHVVQEVSTFVEQERTERNAEHRRAALLEAFSELGYEIREGMETAWVEKNRIVVRKSEQLNHGVELSGNAESGRLQVRPVRFAPPGAQVDRQQDIDIETLWCSDFGKLQGVLSRKGSELTIQKAKSIGETPVKVVEAPRIGRRRGEVSKPRTRQLRND